MSRIKSFIIGALLGTVVGAAFFGAIFHLLLVGCAGLGVGVAVHGGRRRLLTRRETHGSLKA
jgi:hypothetical protein